MADEEAPSVEQTAVAQDVAASASSSRSSRRRANAQPSVEGNCVGELEQLPSVEGATSNRYECQVCHQVVVVGHEQLAESGVPREHAALETEGE